MSALRSMSWGAERARDAETERIEKADSEGHLKASSK